MAPVPDRWSKFSRRAIVVGVVAAASIVFANSSLFPWPELAEAGPRATPIEMLACAFAVLVFMIAQEYKLAGDRRMRWTAAQIACALVVARSTLAALGDWIIRQD